MKKRGWKTKVFFGLLWAFAIGLHSLASNHLPFLSYGLITILIGLIYFLQQKFAINSEDLQIHLLKQKRLEAKAWYFESVITNSGNIIFTTDAEHRILKFNHGSERVFGISQSDVLGKEVYALFESATEISALLARVDQVGSAEASELRIIQSDSGEEIWISLSVTRMLNRDKEIIGEVFNCSNISKRKHLESQLQEKNEQLLRLVITDSLTGLFNVRHLNAELARMFKALKRFPSRSLSIALIDVDHFKTYNDTKGHQAGDHLLVMLSNVFSNELRIDMDSAYRYGGDEFVLVLPDTNAAGAQITCERILASFRKLKVEPTSLSIGIAQYRKDEEIKDSVLAIKEFVQRADDAMYSVKSKGGNNLAIAP